MHQKSTDQQLCYADLAGSHAHIIADLACGHAQSREQGGCLLRRSQRQHEGRPGPGDGKQTATPLLPLAHWTAELEKDLPEGSHNQSLGRTKGQKKSAEGPGLYSCHTVTDYRLFKHSGPSELTLLHGYYELPQVSEEELTQRPDPLTWVNATVSEIHVTCVKLYQVPVAQMA